MSKKKFIEVITQDVNFEERVNIHLEDGYVLLNSGVIVVSSNPTDIVKHWAHLAIKDIKIEYVNGTR